MWPWNQLRGNLLKRRVDGTDLDPASGPGTFSDLNISRQLSPPTQHMLGLKQGCFLLPWLEQLPLALKVTTKEGKRRGMIWQMRGTGRSVLQRLDPWPRQSCCKAEALVPSPSVSGCPLPGASFQPLGKGWEFSFWCSFGWVDNSSLVELLERLAEDRSPECWVAQVGCCHDAGVHSWVYPCTENSF